METGCHPNGQLNIVQVATGPDCDRGHFLYALASDGYLYVWDGDAKEWDQWPGEVNQDSIG